MNFSVKIVADSLTPQGTRVTTMQLCYPRFIHAEFMTHRAFSRNAMSSRAIPVAKMIEQVQERPAMPLHWGKNQPGMQANEQLTGDDLLTAQSAWKHAAAIAADWAGVLQRAGVHKQIANRVLEPFQWMHTIVTATRWDNFFELRCHPDAQPEFQHLAKLMQMAMRINTPRQLAPSDWHLPYVTDEDRIALTIPELVRVSVARCARVSFLNHDGTNPDRDKDLQLHDDLVVAEPMHASPAEHQVLAYGEEVYESFTDEHLNFFQGNLNDIIQYRKILEAARDDGVGASQALETLLQAHHILLREKSAA